MDAGKGVCLCNGGFGNVIVSRRGSGAGRERVGVVCVVLREGVGVRAGSKRGSEGVAAMPQRSPGHEAMDVHGGIMRVSQASGGGECSSRGLLRWTEGPCFAM